MNPYRDIDPARPATMGEHIIRHLIEDRIEDLGKLIHYSDLVGERSQWTFPIALDCGFDGSIVVRVDAIGDCERRPAPPERRNGSHGP